MISSGVRVAGLFLAGMALAAASGCRTAPDAALRDAGTAANAELPRPAGIVRAVDPVEGFVIVDFGVNRVPAPGTAMRARRGDRVVGTIRIVEPSAASLAAADILSGALEAGDLIE